MSCATKYGATAAAMQAATGCPGNSSATRPVQRAKHHNTPQRWAERIYKPQMTYEEAEQSLLPKTYVPLYVAYTACGGRKNGPISAFVDDHWRMLADELGLSEEAEMWAWRSSPHYRQRVDYHSAVRYWLKDQANVGRKEGKVHPTEYLSAEEIRAMRGDVTGQVTQKASHRVMQNWLKERYGKKG